MRAVHNELAIGPNTTLAQRSNDTLITSKVKTRFVEANKFSATHVKVVTERGIVYLMGIVRRDEGDAAGADRQHDVGRRARRQAVRVHRADARGRVLPEPRYPAKIAARADALARFAALPRPRVFTNGVFDILHRGHVTYLEQARGSARRSSSRSTPTLRCAASARAAIARSTRSTTAWRVLAALACVDLVVPFDDDTPRDADRGRAARDHRQGRATTRRRRPPAPRK